MSIVDVRIALIVFGFLLIALLPITCGIRDQCIDRKNLEPLLVFLATGALICYGSVVLITSSEAGYALFIYYVKDIDTYNAMWFRVPTQTTFVIAKCLMYLLYSGRVKAAFKNTIYRIQTREQSFIYIIIGIQAIELIITIVASILDQFTFDVRLFAVAIIIYYTFDMLINLSLLSMFEKRLFKLASAG